MSNAARFRARVKLSDTTTDINIAAYESSRSNALPHMVHDAKVQVMIDAGAMNLGLYLLPVEAEQLGQQLIRAAAALATAPATEGGSR